MRGIPRPGGTRLRPRRARRPAPRPLSEAAALPPARAAVLPPRRSRAVDCGLGAAAASRQPPTRSPRTLPGRAGGVRRSSGAGSRSARGSGRCAAAAAAAAAPLEAGDVGEAVAAAAEAALRTRGKLLADRTPGRDVREPPLPPLTPERSWAREGDPVLPWPAGQPARGGGGKPGSARPGSGRRRPRSSSLGATWRAGGGGDALGLSLGRLPGTAGRCRASPPLLTALRGPGSPRPTAERGTETPLPLSPSWPEADSFGHK